MFRTTSFLALVLAGSLLAAGCGDDDPAPGPTDPGPTQITESFSGTLNVNGGVTHSFVVQRAGAATATISSLTPSDAVVGLSLGPLSAQACSATAGVSRDNATSGTSITGAASAGNFCVRIFDAAGSLPGPVAYELTVTHF